MWMQRGPWCNQKKKIVCLGIPTFHLFLEWFCRWTFAVGRRDAYYDVSQDFLKFFRLDRESNINTLCRREVVWRVCSKKDLQSLANKAQEIEMTIPTKKSQQNIAISIKGPLFKSHRFDTDSCVREMYLVTRFTILCIYQISRPVAMTVDSEAPRPRTTLSFHMFRVTHRTCQNT